MSSFVTSDQTVLAIVQGMKQHKMIDRWDAGYMTDALRRVNETATANRYSEHCKHERVNGKLARYYTDAEVWTSCWCWLYQVDTGAPMTLDEITIKAGVEMLAETVEAANLESGEWRYGNGPYCNDLLGKDEDGCWMNLYDLAEWDLSE